MRADRRWRRLVARTRPAAAAPALPATPRAPVNMLTLAPPRDQEVVMFPVVVACPRCGFHR